MPAVSIAIGVRRARRHGDATDFSYGHLVTNLAPQRGLSGNRVRYAFAHGTRSIAWSTVDLLLAWHLHVVLDLSGVEASALVFAFLVIGALAGLAAGYWLSHSRARAKSYVRLQLISGIAASTLLAFQFLAVSTIVAVVAGVLFRVAFAIQEVTQNALASLLPRDDEETKTYARIHVVLSSAARLIVLVAHILALSFQDFVSRVAIIVGMAVLTMIGTFGLSGVQFPDTRPSPSSFSRHAFHGRLGRLLLAFAISTIMMPTLTRLLIFLPGLPGATNLASWMVGSYYIGSMSGPLLHARLMSSRYARFVAPLCVAVAGVSATIVLFPFPASVRGASAVAHGIALSMLVVGLWSDAAIAARKDGSDGLVFGSVTFTMSIASAIGALLMGPLIERIEAHDWTAIMAAIMLTTVGAWSIFVLRPTRTTASASA